MSSMSEFKEICRGKGGLRDLTDIRHTSQPSLRGPSPLAVTRYSRGHGLLSENADTSLDSRDNVQVVRGVHGRDDENVEHLLGQHLRKVGLGMCHEDSIISVVMLRM
jgi:hypothetical protein